MKQPAAHAYTIPEMCMVRFVGYNLLKRLEENSVSDTIHLVVYIQYQTIYPL